MALNINGGISTNKIDSRGYSNSSTTGSIVPLVPVSSSFLLNAYNKIDDTIVVSGTFIQSQSQYILWSDYINKQIWLSNLINESASFDGYQIFKISALDNQIPTASVSKGLLVYDITTPYFSGSPNPIIYQYDTFDGSNTIEINGVDLIGPGGVFSGSSAYGVIVTVPNTGSYVFELINITYSSGTSSVQLNPSQQQITDNTGAPVLSAGPYYNGHVYFQRHVLSDWDSEALSVSLLSTPVSASLYYNHVSQSIILSGSVTGSTLPGSIVLLGNNLTVISSSVISGSNTVVTFSGSNDFFNTNLYNTVQLQTKIDSYVGGYQTTLGNSYQTVVGKYNTENNIDDLFIIGGGDSTTRRDVFRVSTSSINISGSTYINGPLIVNGTISGSLIVTASWAQSASQAISSSYAVSASYALSSSHAGTSNLVAVSSTNTAGLYYLHFGDKSSAFDNIEVDANLFYDPSTNQLTVANLFGTASWATTSSRANTASIAEQVLVGGTVTSGTNYLTFVNVNNNPESPTNLRTSTNVRYYTNTNLLEIPNLYATTISGSIISASSGITGSLFGTSSWAQSSSQALTASYVNPLNQTVIITGSIILSSSAPPAVAGGIYFDGTDFYLGF